jgi:hypothetical protein
MPSSFNFKLAGSTGFGTGEVSHVYRLVGCCDEAMLDPADEGTSPVGRARLHQLHTHLHCSIIGTCLSTLELRKIIARLTDFDVGPASDLEIHHEGVTLASDKLGSKTLTKALDKRHEATIQAFGKAKDADALAALWQQALQSGAIPGAYWALMSHRHVTPELRQRAFGEVHMLSHLVGAANRADIRRLAALEQENSHWRERFDQQQARLADLLASQEHLRHECERLAVANAVVQRQVSAPDVDVDALKEALELQIQLVRVHTQRREMAEQALAQAMARQEESQQDAAKMRRLNEALTRELGGAEARLQSMAAPDANPDTALARAIEGWKILYVGGRPSSTPAIRKLVADAGAQLVHHDGGMEDRKGLLTGAVAGATIVVFPVDCVDHDSMNNLKRLCARHNVPFLALRTASMTCFAATLSAFASEAPAGSDFRVCLRHG